MERFEVVVVGAGLAGLWCARELAKRGVHVLLVDGKAAVDAVVHTSGIFVRRTVEEFTLPMGSLGRPIRRVRLYSPRRRCIELESPHDEFYVADMRVLYRDLLEGCRRHGVTWRPLTRYSGLRRLERSLLVDLGKTKVQARFIVGADGARSRVAEDLQLSRNHHFVVGLEDVYHGVPDAAPPTLHCVLDPALAPGYIAWVIHDGAQAHVGTAGDPRRFHAQVALERFSHETRQLVDLTAARHMERRGGLIPVNGLLRNVACSSGLLIGDAAGGPSPLTAGGLDPCLRLSEFAAEILAECLAQKTTPEDAYDGRRLRPRVPVRRWMRAALEASTPTALEIAHFLLHARFCRHLAENIFFGRGSFPEPRFVASGSPSQARCKPI